MSKLDPVSPLHHASLRTELPVYDAASLDRACRSAIERARAGYDELARLPLDQIAEERFLSAWDDIEILLDDVYGPASLLNEVHPDSDVREMADERMVDFSGMLTEIYQNEALYERLRALEPQTPEGRILRKDLLEEFEDSGVTLDAAARDRFREISQQITELSQEFARNIREQSSKVRFSAAQLDGLPDSLLSTLQKDGDEYLVGLDYPEYNPFMMTVRDEESRRRLFVAYQQRGGKENLAILDQINALRHEIAGLYGLPSFAHYVTRRRMVGSPEAVEAFLDRVLEAVRDREIRDLDVLRKARAAAEGRDPSETHIRRWDVPYWMERVREERYAVDQEELRQYFPTLPSVEWALTISERLYDLRFERVEVPVWHPDVMYFDVLDGSTSQFIGGIYLDLYPREGKYKHAAAWPVRGASTRIGRKPVSVLVTNFDRRGLTHHELETLLHEFGHVLHGVLSTTRYSIHAGTAVQRDFVEAPSQMFEEWGRRLESLSLMSEICPDCPPIDRDLVERLDSARRFGKGIHYARQHLYASYDMTLAGDGAAGPSLDRWRIMEEETALGYVEQTMFPAGFGHITGGYAAGYYGYLWSETIAVDMLSVFGDDLMSPATGKRFRDQILARGGEVPARELVERFLGRPASPEAFVRELRGRG